MNNGDSSYAMITVGIPTYARGAKVLEAISYIMGCVPAPNEVIVHIDASDGVLESNIRKKYPEVKTISSKIRVGPGGGRHRCMMAATNPFFVSFDDDSWPVDRDFFARVEKYFKLNNKLGVLSTTITHKNEVMPPITEDISRTVEYIGCGHAMRVAAYRDIPGYVDRPWAYGLEERDVGLQVHAKGWEMLRCGDLRVYHDTVLAHHAKAEITTATIENAALFAWLRYPVNLWPYGFAQYLNVIRFLLRARRYSGLFLGIVKTPIVMWQYRHMRKQIRGVEIRTFLSMRKKRY